MNKYKVQVNELNKLYDEVYYSSLDDIEYSLDIITNLISEKEYEEVKTDVSDLFGIIDAIIEILDEVAEVFDNEGLTDGYNLIKEKIDRVQSGEIDDLIENEYTSFPDTIEEVLIDDEDYEEEDEEYNEEYLEDSYDDLEVEDDY